MPQGTLWCRRRFSKSLCKRCVKDQESLSVKTYFWPDRKVLLNQGWWRFSTSSVCFTVFQDYQDSRYGNRGPWHLLLEDIGGKSMVQETRSPNEPIHHRTVLITRLVFRNYSGYVFSTYSRPFFFVHFSEGQLRPVACSALRFEGKNVSFLGKNSRFFSY